MIDVRRVLNPEAMAAAVSRYDATRIQPSARTLETTAAADQFRAQVDGLKLEYRLTAGELQLILAGEITRAARAEVEFERATGNTRPLALRFIKPASEDARDADELEELLDGD